MKNHWPEMLQEVPALAKQYDMLPAGETVLCAVSGGADSMCLLHLLCSLGKTGGFLVSAAHYNHHLRGAESGRDAAFVRDWCQRREIPFYYGEGDVSAAAKSAGEGIEETARRLRYAFLEDTASQLGATRIATAHNADDNGETLLLHLVRGSGLQGLAGIHPRRGRVVRPLLTTSRTEIEAYLKEHHIPHVEDATNQDTAYSRNFLRHEVMPLLKQLNPKLAEALSSTAQSLREDQAFLQTLTGQALSEARQTGDGVSYPAESLAKLPEPLAFRAVQGLAELAGGSAVLSRVHRETVLELVRGKHPSKQADLPGGLTVRRVYGQLLLTLEPSPPALPERILTLPGRLDLPEAGLAVLAEEALEDRAGRPDVFYLSRAKVGETLIVRARRTGDTLALPGRKGTKSLKKWFIEEKVPRHLREGRPVLAVGEQIAAVAGLGADRAFAAGPGEPAWRISFQEEPV